MKFRDFSHNNPLYEYRIRGISIEDGYNKAPQFLVIMYNTHSTGLFTGTFPIYKDPVIPEMKAWLRTTIKRSKGDKKPYHYLYEIFMPNWRVGIGFYNRDDAAHFMLVFNGSNE